jgi:hypothetical protein
LLRARHMREYVYKFNKQKPFKSLLDLGSTSLNSGEITMFLQECIALEIPFSGILTRGKFSKPIARRLCAAFPWPVFIRNTPGSTAVSPLPTRFFLYPKIIHKKSMEKIILKPKGAGIAPSNKLSPEESLSAIRLSALLDPFKKTDAKKIMLAEISKSQAGNQSQTLGIAPRLRNHLEFLSLNDLPPNRVMKKSTAILLLLKWGNLNNRDWRVFGSIQNTVTPGPLYALELFGTGKLAKVRKSQTRALKAFLESLISYLKMT